jgi:hypothetical protein
MPHHAKHTNKCPQKSHCKLTRLLHVVLFFPQPGSTLPHFVLGQVILFIFSSQYLIIHQSSLPFRMMVHRNNTVFFITVFISTCCLLAGAVTTCDVVNDVSMAAGAIKDACSSTAGEIVQTLVKQAKVGCRADTVIAVASTFASNRFCSGSKASVVVQPLAVCSSEPVEANCTSDPDAAQSASCSTAYKMDCVEDFTSSNNACLDCTGLCPFSYSWEYTYAAQASMMGAVLSKYCGTQCTGDFGNALYNDDEGYMFEPVSCGLADATSPYVLAADTGPEWFEASLKNLSISLFQQSGLSVKAYYDPVVIFNNSLFDASAQCDSITWAYIPSLYADEPDSFSFYDCQLYFSVSNAAYFHHVSTAILVFLVAAVMTIKI